MRDGGGAVFEKAPLRRQHLSLELKDERRSAVRKTGEEDPRKIIYSKGQHPETGKSSAFERDKKEGSQDGITAVLFMSLKILVGEISMLLSLTIIVYVLIYQIFAIILLSPFYR